MGKQAEVRGIFDYRDLVVWQKAMDLAVCCFELAATFGPRGGFALPEQLRRASLSVPSNIAEGHSLVKASFRHHVRVALGSLAELATQVEIARRLALISEEDARGVDTRVGSLRPMLRRLHASLRPATKAQAQPSRP
jgi:four helix bundle protein